MIVVARQPDALLVRQVDHQLQCADFALAWGNDLFARLPGHRHATIAARWHDEGWREWEQCPRIDSTGAPMDFPDLDRTEHVRLYRAGIDLAERIDPRAGLLVSMHGAGLYQNRRGLDRVVPPSGRRPAAVESFLANEDVRQARLVARLGAGPELERWGWAAYRLLQAWDLLSLALLWGRLAERERVVLRRVPRDLGDGEGCDIGVRRIGRRCAVVDPWPFSAAHLETVVPARRVAPGPHDSHAALTAAFREAPEEPLRIVLRPA